MLRPGGAQSRWSKKLWELGADGVQALQETKGDRISLAAACFRVVCVCMCGGGGWGGEMGQLWNSFVGTPDQAS